MFLDAKKIEGCSERTLLHYRVTVDAVDTEHSNADPQGQH